MTTYKPPNSNTTLQPFNPNNFMNTPFGNRMTDYISINEADKIYLKRFSYYSQVIYGNVSTISTNYLRRKTPSWCVGCNGMAQQAPPAVMTYNTTYASAVDVDMNLSTGKCTIKTFGLYMVQLLAFTQYSGVYTWVDVRLRKNSNNGIRQYTSQPLNFYQGGMNLAVIVQCVPGDVLDVYQAQGELHKNMNIYFSGFKIC